MKRIFTFVLAPIILTTLGEFLLKSTINQSEVAVSAKGLGMILQTPLIILGVVCIFTGGLLWLVAMSKFELSFIYPFLSINYLGIIIGSQWLLDEKVTLFRYVSVALIIIGLIVISRSPHAKKEET